MHSGPSPRSSIKPCRRSGCSWRRSHSARWRRSTYAKARRFADRHGLRLYTHVAETRNEVDGIAEAHGARPVELLHRLGFAGEDTILVHCVFLSAGEMRRLGRSGTHVVHCPTNHLKLAKGVAPVTRLLAAGVNVALGVDTMDDLFSEMRQVMLVQGLVASNPGAITPLRSLEMACKGGAVALGLGAELGSIEVGKRADVVCVDMQGGTSPAGARSGLDDRQPCPWPRRLSRGR